jgi:hypothetical protein
VLLQDLLKQYLSGEVYATLETTVMAAREQATVSPSE